MSFFSDVRASDLLKLQNSVVCELVLPGAGFAEKYFQFLSLWELEGKTWENMRIENEIYDIEIYDIENYFVSVGMQEYIIHR